MKKEGNNKRVLFVSNAGGHLSEMMALKSLFKEYKSMLLTENEIASKKIEIDIPVKFMTNYRRKQKNIFVFFAYLLYNFTQILYIQLTFRPDIIITTGSNLAVPACYVGKLFFSKIVFIEITAKVTAKSKTGRIIEPIADLIIVQWPEMLKIYKKSVYWGITF